MNRSFFLSRFAIWALVVAGGFVAWLSVGGYAMGRAYGSDRGYLLWTGWVAFVLFLVVAGYSLRKFIHRMGISPEFKMRVDPGQVERTQAHVTELRRLIATDAIRDEKEVLTRAKEAIAKEGVGKVLRAHVSRDDDGISVELLPTEPLGRMDKWMHAHLYLGLAAAVMVILHGGGTFASPMALLLNGLSLLVIGSGVYGIFVWAKGPALMTKSEHDLTIEEAFVLERSLSRKVDAGLEEPPFAGPFAALGEPDWKAGFLSTARSGDEFSAAMGDVLGVLKSQAVADRASAKAAKDKVAEKAAAGRVTACSTLVDFMALCGQRARIDRELTRLKRGKALLNSWRTVHVPLSVLLLGLLLFHIASVWWY